MLCAALLLSWAVASQWVGRAPSLCFHSRGPKECHGSLQACRMGGGA